jgi:hypothetical protein
MLTKIRDRLTLNQQKSHRFHMVMFNQFNELESKEWYGIELSNNLQLWTLSWK